MANKRHDGHIFGVARYIANTLGVAILNTQSSDLIDQPMSCPEKKQAWRIATFRCRCEVRAENSKNFGVRTFCNSCYHLIFQKLISHITLCPSCNENESWESLGHPCLACQMVALVFHNPFSLRFQQQLERCLHNNDTDSGEGEAVLPTCPHISTIIQSEYEMLQR